MRVKNPRAQKWNRREREREEEGATYQNIIAHIIIAARFVCFTVPSAAITFLPFFEGSNKNVSSCCSSRNAKAATPNDRSQTHFNHRHDHNIASFLRTRRKTVCFSGSASHVVIWAGGFPIVRKQSMGEQELNDHCFASIRITIVVKRPTSLLQLFCCCHAASVCQ